MKKSLESTVLPPKWQGNTLIHTQSTSVLKSLKHKRKIPQTQKKKINWNKEGEKLRENKKKMPSRKKGEVQRKRGTPFAKQKGTKGNHSGENVEKAVTNVWTPRKLLHTLGVRNSWGNLSFLLSKANETKWEIKCQALYIGFQALV